MRAQSHMLADGRRLHLQDGPIDIVLEAFGAEDQKRIAYRSAIVRFATVLDELCSELPLLRAQAIAGGVEPSGTIARRMLTAVLPYAKRNFITPMAAVAGAVAEEILGAMTESAKLARAYVNNGGDIALHLSAGEKFIVGMVERPDRPSLLGTMVLDPSQAARGIATSGWRGRSFSLGIADAVTVLGRTAAMADAAATMIANEVDLPGHPHITRLPADELSPDNDLGNRLVTTAVGELTREEVSRALARGVECAESLIEAGLINAAALNLQEHTRIVPLEALKVGGKSAHRRLVHA